MNYSQTQLSNLGIVAGLIVIIANKFGLVLATDEVTFVLGAVISVGFTVYNYYQRFKKGDLTLGGFRK